jgi:glycosyltransferase involved in cell wall biosynthesis
VRLGYAVVTPVCDEARNLRRLHGALAAQTILPLRWVIVDTGSSDDSVAVSQELARSEAWIAATTLEARPLERGGPIVEGFERGLPLVPAEADVIVKLDADVTMEPEYFASLLAAFEADDRLGIASGTAFELDRGEWRQRFSTGDAVWGASRAYRRACLEQIGPLERRMGWDGIDEIRAQLRGWETRTLLELPFRHHRVEGQRDGARWRAWSARGRAAHYMGYRAWYLALRALHHTRHEPAALAMIWGFAAAAVTRKEVVADPAVRAHLRQAQRLSNLRTRRREALGA